jgi:SAM-dependent methyltransferase
LLFLLAYPFRLSLAEAVPCSRVDFDQYARQYEDILAAQMNFFDGDSGYFFARYKIELAQQLAGSVSSVLDFGCGIGRSMPYLRQVFPKAEIVGCDPSAESLAIARRENPSCRFASMDDLGADAKFDLVIASCIFHHIPPQDRQMAIRYCYSRLKDGGHFIIFEHNPINPGHAPSGQELPLRRGRGTAGHARDDRTHAQRTSAYRRVELLPVLPAAALGASPVREISSLAADGRAVFGLRFQSKRDAA